MLNVVYIENPEWCASFELWPDEVVETRRRLLTRAAEEDLVLIQCHFPMPGLGRVRVSGGSFRWIPIEAEPVTEG